MTNSLQILAGFGDNSPEYVQFHEFSVYKLFMVILEKNPPKLPNYKGILKRQLLVPDRVLTQLNNFAFPLLAPSYYDEMDWFNNFNEAANASKCKDYITYFLLTS